MKAIVLVLRANSLFSIRIPYTWQSALSYPLPPPSSIIGMLANALQRYKNNKHPTEHLKMIEENVKWAGAKLCSPAVIKSYITSAITKWDVKIGSKSTNVLGREYVFVRNIQILTLINDDSFADELIIALKCAPITCGDSESIASIEKFEPLRAVKICKFTKETVIETEYPVRMDFEKLEVLNGTGRLYLMHEKCRKAGEKFPLFYYLLPIQEEKGILLPSKFKIKMKKDLDGFEIEDEGQVITLD